MAKTIPEIRARLHVLAVELKCPELAELAEDTKRRFHGRIAPIKQRPITPEVIAGVRSIHRHIPTMHQREIANWFGIDQGRVNEILHGYRDGTSYEARHPMQ